MKTRTFVAITPSSSQTRRVAGLIERLEPLAGGARWVDPEQLHLTLLFLGDLSDQEVADVCQQAEWVARANQPFQLRLGGVGAFPHLERPRALWLGARDGQAAVQRLHDDLLDALGGYVSARDRRSFVPHVTLARMTKNRGGSPRLTSVVAGLADYDAGATEIDEITVFSSELYAAGPEYYSLATHQLGD